jgi:hypothetical protein
LRRGTIVDAAGSAGLPEAAAASPRWFPFALDPDTDRVLLVAKSEAEYRADSFLDQRSLRPDAERRTVGWAELAGALPADARRDVQYIFHIGHVGSTLVSRLLGEMDGVFALREPMLLRTFAEMPAGWTAPRLDPLTALLSRTFRPDQRALVKATSFTSEMADRLVPPGSRALFLFATPAHYIENILAGDNSRQELHLLSPGRIERLRTRCPDLTWELERLSEARRAALGWACEMTSLERSAAAMAPGDVMWMDFDRFLTEPAGHLAEIARFFGHSLDHDAAAAICAGPLMGRYSKAPEFEYTPALRRDVLAEARFMHGPAIRDALLWLEEAGRRYPAIGSAIRRAQ